MPETSSDVSEDVNIASLDAEEVASASDGGKSSGVGADAGKLTSEGSDVTDSAGESEAESETAAESVAGPAPDPQWRPIVQRHRVPIAAVTLVLMVGIVIRLGFHLSTLPVLAFATTATALAVVDFAILRLPNLLVATAGVLVVLTCTIQAIAEHHTHMLVTGAEGALGVALFYLLLYTLSRGGLGLGDVKLGAVAGFLLASRNWQHVFNGTFLAYLITLAIAIAMMTRGRKKFPYGPGILAGTIAVLLLS